MLSPLKKLKLLSAIASSNSYASFVLSKLPACFHNSIYYIDTSVLLGTKPPVDSIRLLIRDLSGIFSVWHLCECRIVQWRHDCRLLLLLNLLNLSKYDRNIFGSSSVVLGNLRQSSENLRKCSENFRKRSSCFRNNFRKSSEIFGKWSEIFGNSSKTASVARLYNKKNITR